MTASFELEGDEELIAKLERLVPRFKQATENALADWADDVMNESKRLCPVDTGALRASGFTETTLDDSGVSVKMGYTQDYALAVHENLQAYHEVGQAKFLEEPVLMKSGELAPRILNYIEKSGDV